MQLNRQRTAFYRYPHFYTLFDQDPANKILLIKLKFGSFFLVKRPETVFTTAIWY